MNNPVNGADPSGHYVRDKTREDIQYGLGGVYVAATLVLAQTVLYVFQEITKVIVDTVDDIITKNELKDQIQDQSVYVMKDKTTEEVKYIGRTNDPGRRNTEHTKKKAAENLTDLIVVATGLTKDQAKLAEQSLIVAYGLSNLNNRRNEISQQFIDNYISLAGESVSLRLSVTEDELYHILHFWEDP